MVARIGGDEFALLLTGSNALRRRALAERTLTIFKRRVRFDGAVLRSGASAGGALQTALDGRSPEHLLRSVDTAMYVAKKTSRERYRKAAPD